jgi:4'-phosphopantetheinyl transferase
MGCDLEKLEDRDASLIEDYFTPEEMAWCMRDPLNKALNANLIWSAKESMLKALREGLRRDTRSVVVQPGFQDNECGWKMWSGSCLVSSRSFHGWWRSRDGFIYTLASDRYLEPSNL